MAVNYQERQIAGVSDYKNRRVHWLSLMKKNAREW
jgi:hypothetical protein